MNLGSSFYWEFHRVHNFLIDICRSGRGFFCLFQNTKFKFEWDPLGILSWIFDNFFTDSSGILVSTWHDAAVAGQVSSNVKLKRRTRMSSDLRVVDKGLRGSKVNEGGHFFSLLLFFQLRFIKERRACGEASHTHVHTRTHTHTHAHTHVHTHKSACTELTVALVFS